MSLFGKLVTAPLLFTAYVLGAACVFTIEGIERIREWCDGEE